MIFTCLTSTFLAKTKSRDKKVTARRKKSKVSKTSPPTKFQKLGGGGALSLLLMHAFAGHHNVCDELYTEHLEIIHGTWEPRTQADTYRRRKDFLSPIKLSAVV